MESVWNFPNCIGSIDGKHIQIEAPPRSGSQNLNYKKTFSIVMMASCDAQYRFLYVDVGHLGGESDGGIFARSSLLEGMENGSFSIPQPRDVGSAKSIPYLLLGDEAFPLKPFLMRPFPQRSK